MNKSGNAKSRVILALFAAIALVVVAAMLWRHYTTQTALQSSAHVTGSPSVTSLPGAGNPSDAYVKAQVEQNAQQAAQARQNATSAVPTITRAEFTGSPDDFISNSSANSNQCPLKTIEHEYRPNPANCDVDNLRLARRAGVTAEELRCQACSCPALHAAGFTVGELKDTGYTASDLKNCGFSLTDLVNAGFSAADLKAAGFSASDLKAAGFTADQLKAAGFNANELAQAGFTPDANANNAACSPTELQHAHDAGVSAAALTAKGCGLAALKAAGYTAAELKSAGFTAQQLKDAGFSAKDLHDAGFSAADLKAAGFSAGQLKAAGYSAADLKAAGFSAKDLHDAGFTAAELKAAGYSPDELRAAGYTKGDLLRAGFSAKDAGYAPETVAPTTATTAATTNVGASVPSIDGNNEGDSLSARIRAIQALQQQELSDQQQRDLSQQMQAQMSLQSQKLMAGWSNSDSQQYQQGVAPVEVAANNAAGVGVNAAAVNSGPTVKAGSIMFAVLDTSINSDENSPILATIVGGPLKGAKLIGAFTRVDKKVLIKFNLINVPSLPKSITADAVAIDPNTARTALSGSVNNHYLLRYGTLFASSFLSGIADGITQTVSTQNCLFGSFFCQSQPNQSLNTGEYVLLGLGNTGKQYANEMGQNFNTPPTIKVQGGMGIGVLFMNDVTLPTNVDMSAAK